MPTANRFEAAQHGKYRSIERWLGRDMGNWDWMAIPSHSIDASVADDTDNTDGTNDSNHVEPSGHRHVHCHGQIEKAATNADNDIPSPSTTYTSVTLQKWYNCKQRWSSTPIYVSRKLRYPQRATLSSRRSGRHRDVKETKSNLIITAVRNRPAKERSSS
ncbi:hypothetical protein CPLU01_10675 [Colletotrichum plurivorum]|uniref:Uncharacterized protein n=1 Tax=Colletotrichum plurivorum TaxID=2175906 RepID=A0A8H6K5Q7_9PEZI|nr:hypothetical protein CPLU01_10675 [Colletotrichum plurivorum]